jgi:hypothetical protein
MGFWETVGAALLATATAAAIREGYRWMKRRNMYEFEMDYVLGNVGAATPKQLRRHQFIPLGFSRAQLRIAPKGTRRLEKISVRFCQNRRRGESPDDADQSAVRVLAVRCWDCESGELGAYALQGKSDGVGGIEARFDSSLGVPRAKGQPLFLIVELEASREWSGFLSFLDRQEYEGARLPIAVDPNLHRAHGFVRET